MDRQQKASDYFRQGYKCARSVFVAFADREFVDGFEEEHGSVRCLDLLGVSVRTSEDLRRARERICPRRDVSHSWPTRARW